MDVSAGSHVLLSRATKHTSSGSSVSALVSTLVPVLLVSVIVFTVFLIMQKTYERVYGPRTFVESLRGSQLSPKRSTGLFGWHKEYSQLRDEFVLGHSSLDNYLWLRFFKSLVIMCFVGCLISWPILFPVNATAGGGETGFDILSMANTKPGARYYAQTFVAWAFLAFVMFLITRESIFFVRLRQQFLLSPYSKSLVSSRTVLFTNVPEENRNEERLRGIFAGVRKVWLVNVPTELADRIAERDKIANKLDASETKLLKKHVKRQLKLEKKGKATPPAKIEEGVQPAVEVNKKDRPTHRLPIAKLPIGKKVDTVNWSRSELHRLVPQCAQGQLEHRNTAGAPQSACFIEFESVQAAHEAMLQARKEKKGRMAPEAAVAPDQVIWTNIIKSPSKCKTIKTIGTAFVVWLCIFWTIPVAVIGSISNINSLTNLVPFLSFINDIPKVILGVVTGLLPVILLAVLMALVPIIMGVIARKFEPTQGLAQLRTQKWYFPFQVVQVFLVTTFASGAAAVVTKIIEHPTKAPTLLAKNLPKASNFYIDYFVLYGLNAAAMQFLNVVPLLFALVLGNFLDGTATKKFNRYVTLGGLGWGSIYPVYTNLGVIALAYSSIAPLVLGFATAGFALIYLGFRYNLLFVLGTTASTSGRSYTLALQQLTTGIYLSEFCLIGLFAIGSAKSTMSIGPLVLMIIFMVGTIVWHVFLNRTLAKMEAELPSEEITEKIKYGNADQPDIEKQAGHNGNGNGADTTAAGPVARQPVAAMGELKGPGFMELIKEFFKPTKNTSRVVESIAPLVDEPLPPYSQRESDEAYIHPAATSECPIVWVPEDKYGLSKQEIAASRREIGEGFEMTDQGAWFNEKGKIEWGIDNVTSMPVWKDKVMY